MNLCHHEIERAFEHGLEDSGCRESFCQERSEDFSEYVHENFKEIVVDFHGHLHPAVILDDDEFPWDLFDAFLWKVLKQEKRDILVRAYCESNWEGYKDFVSEFVGQLGEY